MTAFFCKIHRYITKDELSRIVKAVYDLMGRAVEPLVEEHTTREHVERVFNRLDLNKDGVVTIDEFMDSCTKVLRGRDGTNTWGQQLFIDKCI